MKSEKFELLFFVDRFASFRPRTGYHITEEAARKAAKKPGRYRIVALLPDSRIDVCGFTVGGPGRIDKKKAFGDNSSKRPMSGILH